MAKLEKLQKWIIRNAKFVMPVVLVLCVIVTIVISLNANRKEVEAQVQQTVSDGEYEDILGIGGSSILEDAEGISIAVPEVPLEENVYPEIDELVKAYYAARADGDIETIKSLVDQIENTRVLRIEEMSKYIESYPKVDIYTKVGPEENTFLVYVSSEVKFYDYEKCVPGMSAYYVCMNDDGQYYIKISEEIENEGTVANYIREVSVQDDVVDLNNQVTVAYNNLVTEDSELAKFLLDLYDEIDKNVGEALAKIEGSSTGQDASKDAAEEAEASQEESSTVVTKVKATDVVNIRTSDSETADKLGKAAVGDEFELMEKRGNGWSKIIYEGKEAFIKSDYLETAETMVVEQADNADDENTSADQDASSEQTASSNQTTSSEQTSSSEQPATNGTVTVLENVRIRASASENSQKLGTAYKGDKLDLIMKQADGWTKIKYNGGTAYVKSDYVQ